MFGWIDVVFIVVILIFALVGLARGFIDSVLSMIGSVLAIVIAFVVSRPVSGFLNKVVGADLFFSKILKSWKVPEVVTVFGKQFSLNSVASLCTIAFSIILVWLLIKIVVWLLSKLFSDFASKTTFGSGINKVLGLVFGAIKGFCIACAALAITSFVAIVPTVGNKINTEIQKNSMTNFVYKYVSSWTSDYVEKNIDKYLGNFITPEESETPEASEEDNTNTPSESIETTLNF